MSIPAFCGRISLKVIFLYLYIYGSLVFSTPYFRK
nr:MAG TPA: hypothetical protein [Caudoviricetes sp.]